jgi:hypothetical protein
VGRARETWWLYPSLKFKVRVPPEYAILKPNPFKTNFFFSIKQASLRSSRDVKKLEEVVVLLTSNRVLLIIQRFSISGVINKKLIRLGSFLINK